MRSFFVSLHIFLVGYFDFIHQSLEFRVSAITAKLPQLSKQQIPSFYVFLLNMVMFLMYYNHNIRDESIRVFTSFPCRDFCFFRHKFSKKITSPFQYILSISSSFYFNFWVFCLNLFFFFWQTYHSCHLLITSLCAKLSLSHTSPRHHSYLLKSYCDKLMFCNISLVC